MLGVLVMVDELLVVKLVVAWVALLLQLELAALGLELVLVLSGADQAELLLLLLLLLMVGQSELLVERLELELVGCVSRHKLLVGHDAWLLHVLSVNRRRLVEAAKVRLLELELARAGQLGGRHKAGAKRLLLLQLKLVALVRRLEELRVALVLLDVVLLRELLVGLMVVMVVELELKVVVLVVGLKLVLVLMLVLMLMLMLAC